MAYTVMAFIITAYIVMAYIVMTCTVMAYIIMDCVTRSPARFCHSEHSAFVGLWRHMRVRAQQRAHLVGDGFVEGVGIERFEAGNGGEGMVIAALACRWRAILPP